MSATHGQVNQGYQTSYDDNDNEKTLPKSITANASTKLELQDSKNDEKERPEWGNGLEFLMSCIAMSVGLGNIWRFPFTAFENGGGAFLIPYIIVLILIGRPMYYMEMLLGQFSSRGPSKMYDELSPGFVGVGFGQMLGTICVATYYCSLMALTFYYMVASFTTELPWAKCLPEWGDICYDSAPGGNYTNATNRRSSSELYFYKTVLKEAPNIDDGIGMPDLRLTICLLISWICIFVVAIRGVKSSGKASYFLALFPYVIMFALFIRAVTLPGAGDGIIFFIKPQWEKLLEPQVWYAAVTQAFFSLNVGFGTIIMYSSYNNFAQNVKRDAMIVTTLDTLTSLLAGSTIFGILGNLAYVSQEDITNVVKGGTGLAFVSYPDAIAKFDWAPQFFSVLFFFMLFVLAVGSLVALINNLSTCLKDEFTNLKSWHISLGLSVIGFIVGLIYVTPGGQFMLTLIDYFGGTFIILVVAIFEMACIMWVYGLNNFCIDVEFMLNIKVGAYWRVCWGFVSPLLLIVITIYTFVTIEPLKYNGVGYPTSFLAIGWLILFVGCIQLPIWACWAIWKNSKNPKSMTICAAFKPNESWGPKNQNSKMDWIDYKMKVKEEMQYEKPSLFTFLKNTLCGSE
ncbi:sodium-dependent nutrient amino acid transporter 1-like isoform X2 [Chrysoperla carnea]|uniref:sodium-dependent nutrient amino acid transporter 1-like isoform X2 n=1 Tax=Chrysoperla carnea TaxID=189513 RepID=UPI001D077A5C|nr:sodium-dependent nutrient amino acid transporter 1-like isoform X2 [Chrysoperla carnea]